MVKAKTPRESICLTTEQVLPNDTNPLNTLFGGRLMQWMDITAGIAAHRHCGKVCVTASVNHVSFDKPVKLGDVVTLEGKVSRTFNTSIEVFVDVWVENPTGGGKKKCNEAILTFVAVDLAGKPVPVLPVVPETEEEKTRFDGALRRRQLALILAGRMKADDATELKALFGK
ncbi:MAG: acyl-CoA thioesterase [Bacteroidetes bacterium]|nr:acyl-CoA thioesterase [Bacteroidota bacterium]